jgi:hypothetical protein
MARSDPKIFGQMVRRLLNGSRRCRVAHRHSTADASALPPFRMYGLGQKSTPRSPPRLRGCSPRPRFRRAFAQPQHRFAPSQPIPKGNRLTISVNGRIIWMFGFCLGAIRRNSRTARCCSTWYCFFKRLSPFLLAEKARPRHYGRRFRVTTLYDLPGNLATVSCATCGPKT